MNVKKRAPARKSAEVDVKLSGAAQSAAERKSAEAQVNAIIEKFSPANLKLVTSVRKSVKKRLLTAHEVVYEYRSWFVISYSPSGQGYEGVLAIRGDADGVKFYFNQGKDLPDPEKLLKGLAQVRFIELESASTLAQLPVARLIEEAIARNRVPFANTGEGSIIIRSASAKKPPPAKSAKAVAGSKTSKAKKKK